MPFSGRKRCSVFRRCVVGLAAPLPSPRGLSAWAKKSCFMGDSDNGYLPAGILALTPL